MEITWYGHSCFRITERNMATVVTDPYDHSVVGYKALKLKADIVTISKVAPGHNHVSAVKGSSWELNGQGEYEIGGVFITAVPTGKEATDKNPPSNMVYSLDYNGINVVHLGDMDKIPSRSQVEAFGTVDVLLVPVGGGNALNASKASEVISLLEPGFIVPMHYKTSGSSVELNEISQFLKEMGLGENVETQASLKVVRSGIPEEIKVIILDHSR